MVSSIRPMGPQRASWRTIAPLPVCLPALSERCGCRNDSDRQSQEGYGVSGSAQLRIIKQLALGGASARLSGCVEPVLISASEPLHVVAFGLSNLTRPLDRLFDWVVPEPTSLDQFGCTPCRTPAIYAPANETGCRRENVCDHREIHSRAALKTSPRHLLGFL